MPAASVAVKACRRAADDEHESSVKGHTRERDYGFSAIVVRSPRGILRADAGDRIDHQEVHQQPGGRGPRQRATNRWPMLVWVRMP